MLDWQHYQWLLQYHEVLEQYLIPSVIDQYHHLVGVILGGRNTCYYYIGD